MRRRLRSWVQRVARDSVRDELATHAEAVEQSVARAQRELEVHVDAAARSTDAALVAHQEQMADAVRALAGAIAQLSTHLDGQRHDLRAHLDRTELIMRELVLVLGAFDVARVDPAFGRPTILGGTVDASLATGAAHAHDGERPVHLDLRESLDGELVQIWSHFRGAWTSGFRLLGTVEDERGRWARIERISDRYELPMLFDVSEVRLAGDDRSRPLSTPTSAIQPSITPER